VPLMRMRWSMRFNRWKISFCIEIRFKLKKRLFYGR
jgi:hypothetical protein